jgi:hypothetical protein
VAIDWASGSTLADDNTITLSATAPYTRSLATYNMTTGNDTSYPADGTDSVWIRSPLTFSKNNDTSEMTATVYLYLER